MFESIISKTYTFKNGDGKCTCEYTRYKDGSAYVCGDDFEAIYEGHVFAWQSALKELEQRGYIIE